MRLLALLRAEERVEVVLVELEVLLDPPDLGGGVVLLAADEDHRLEGEVLLVVVHQPRRRLRRRSYGEHVFTVG